MNIIDRINGRTRAAYLHDSEHVKGRPVVEIELDAIGPACRGVVIGRATIRTDGGGVIYAVLVESDAATAGVSSYRAVYLDRDANVFVSIEVPS